jgi:hypothetical protein
MAGIDASCPHAMFDRNMAITAPHAQFKILAQRNIAINAPHAHGPSLAIQRVGCTNVASEPALGSRPADLFVD